MTNAIQTDPDYARRDKDLAWDKISHEMKESGMCIYVYPIISFDYIYNRNL
jgi:hypothetical protein